MPAARSFTVFGEAVEILISGDMTSGASATLTQVSPPGGGVPPHSHQNEDETFFVVEGEYEFLSDGNWVKLNEGESLHARRGSVHGFRNVGASSGKLLIFVSPSGLETYLEEISTVTMPNDIERLIAVSTRYGIAFPEMSAV